MTCPCVFNARCHPTRQAIQARSHQTGMLCWFYEKHLEADSYPDQAPDPPGVRSSFAGLKPLEADSTTSRELTSSLSPAGLPIALGPGPH